MLQVKYRRNFLAARHDGGKYATIHGMKAKTLLSIAFAAQIALNGGADTGDIVLKNSSLRLVIGADACAKSLTVRGGGEELLDASERIALFSTTQERPFNNEIKLAWPNKRTTYQANRIHREGDELVVGFEIAPYEAVVGFSLGDGYIAFTLKRFNCVAELQYEGLRMDVPPVASFRLVQLPAVRRKNLGDWLNVTWDDRGAVAVVGADPYALIDHERRNGFELLNADLLRGLELKGGKAAIVAGAGQDAFLAAMEAFERDFGLPHGVESRRNPLLNASIYWTSHINPSNVDDHIALAKKGGFRLMLIYYTAMTKALGGYAQLGDYDWNDDYPNGLEDLRTVLSKIRAAGILPGFHTLQTHIGKDSRYVTPVADPRLNLTRRFTLARPIAAEGEPGEIEVLENPVDAPMHKDVRVLKFGGELFRYAAYTDKPPYRFTGVTRGYWKTTAAAHPRGEIGGVLDVSEFAAISCYLDQKTDLQDEVAKKIAKIYDAGMGFCYFDGSEGVDPPCGVNVSLAQYRVVRAFAKPPLFTEGAAKSHFGWHLQAGANAFDIFPPEIFKKMIAVHPQAEAPIMHQNFTRLDFGWWGLYQPGQKVLLKDRLPYKTCATIGTQPDMWEFGTSRAAAWNCPATVMLDPGRMAKHPRGDDLLEVMRRWEDVRARRLLDQKPEWRAALKSPTQEHHLYAVEGGEYELHPIEMLPTPAKAPDARAFIFERGGSRMIAYWHTRGSAKLEVALGGAAETVPLDKVRYLTTALPKEAAAAAWAASTER